MDPIGGGLPGTFEKDLIPFFKKYLDIYTIYGYKSSEVSTDV
jgi:hypothetical protein